jgi:hypothetical protein
LGFSKDSFFFGNWSCFFVFIFTYIIYEYEYICIYICIYIFIYIYTYTYMVSFPIVVKWNTVKHVGLVSGRFAFFSGQFYLSTKSTRICIPLGMWSITMACSPFCKYNVFARGTWVINGYYITTFDY